MIKKEHEEEEDDDDLCRACAGLSCGYSFEPRPNSRVLATAGL